MILSPTTTTSEQKFARHPGQKENENKSLFHAMNTSLEMEGVQMEEKDKAWYCLLCSTSLAPELGQEGVLLETARFP